MAHRIPMPPKKAAKAKRDEGFNWDAEYPQLKLPVRPPFPPMEARSRDELPQGDAWLYEPKWDGFRCLAFRDGEEVILQSKAGQPLGRYFPEIVEAVGKLAAEKFALDGEIVIEIDGRLDFDALLQRIHPAASRIQRLSKETPAKYLCFDLLVDAEARDLTREPLRDRKIQLEEFSRRVLTRNKSIEVPPWSRELKDAEKWLHELAEYGCDGIVAKLAEEPYHSGDREAMVKVKRMRTADCVVGGFRYATKKENGIGSLLLGLYNDAGQLDHIGFCSSFTAPQRLELVTKLKPLIGGSGFTGKAPGGPSRWNAYNERSAEWVALDPKLVVEVQYDHFSGGRFRHGTKFLRWRPDKAPKQCTMEQVRPAGKRAA
jgi:ATP-dependent DNA ligase